MKLKFFAGVWDSWGLAISVSRWSKSLTINLIHWYFTVELWTKEDMRVAEKNMDIFKDLIDKYEKEKKKSSKPKKSK